MNGESIIHTRSFLSIKSCFAPSASRIRRTRGKSYGRWSFFPRKRCGGGLSTNIGKNTSLTATWALASEESYLQSRSGPYWLVTQDLQDQWVIDMSGSI